MRYSQLFGKTKFSAPADADSTNAKFLTQGGFIDKLAAGVYTYLPLGLRVLKKVTTIIREEMDAIGGQEVAMPQLHPRELWITTGRDKTMDDILFRTTGAGDHDFVIGPSHEEVVTPLAKNFIQSYKDLPCAVYQIQTKFRNEPRAKSGVLRGREFGMKDMYSFHADEEDLNQFYEKATQAYLNVFERCGLDAYLMEASGGVFTTNKSHEFAIKTPAGEDTMLMCEGCRYAQNLEIAEADFEKPAHDEKELPLKKVKAEREASIDAGVKLHGVPASKILKSVIYKVNDGLLGVCIRGDLQVNQARLEKHLRGKVHPASANDLKEAGLAVGFISPIGLKIPFIADHSVKYVKNFVTGANEPKMDLLNANVGRDFQAAEFIHLSDLPIICPKCKKPMKEERAIEAGNIFKLGTKYSKDCDLTFTDKNGETKLVIMGCYGIGTTRLVGTVVEACHDDNGIMWPKTIAPFAVHLISLSGNDAAIAEKAEALYKKLQEKKIEVLFDDRDESAGKKFKDADLIGIPVRIVISKKTVEKNGVELKKRSEKEATIIDEKDIFKHV